MGTERYQLVYTEERKNCKYESSPVEHPEYSLGLAFSRLLSEFLSIPEVRLHLFEIHASDGGEGVPGGRRGRMGGGLLFSGRADFSDVLRTVAPVSAAVELAFSARVLRLPAILYAVSFFSAVEALVALWKGCFTLALLLLIIPREGTDFVGLRAWSYL